MKTKIPFIIGLGQKAKEFRFLSKYFKIIQPDWNNGSLSKMKLGKPKIIAGFSLGCMIATMQAEKNKVETLILCSPTPDETLKNVKAEKVIFLVGHKEEWVYKEIKRVRKTLKCSSTIKIIPNAGHKIDTVYKNALIGIVK